MPAPTFSRGFRVLVDDPWFLSARYYIYTLIMLICMTLTTLVTPIRTLKHSLLHTHTTAYTFPFTLSLFTHLPFTHLPFTLYLFIPLDTSHIYTGITWQSLSPPHYEPPVRTIWPLTHITYLFIHKYILVLEIKNWQSINHGRKIS